MEKQQIAAPQIFEHEQFGSVRGIIVDGEPRFCLSDVCKILDLRIDGVVMRLKDDPSNTGVVDEVLSKHPIQDTIGRTQEMYFVNEDGLYDTILDSRKPEAKRFRKWITREVLPALRKYGYYALSRQNKQTYPELDDLTVKKFLRILDAVENYKRAAYDYEAKEKRINELRDELLNLENECKVLLSKKQELIAEIDSSLQEFFL